MSVMVSSVAASLLKVPGNAVSPCSTTRRVIRPDIGARIVVRARLLRASRSDADDWSAFCEADSMSAVFTSTAVLSCSSSSAEMSVAFVFWISIDRA